MKSKIIFYCIILSFLLISCKKNKKLRGEMQCPTYQEVIEETKNLKKNINNVKLPIINKDKLYLGRYLPKGDEDVYSLKEYNFNMNANGHYYSCEFHSVNSYYSDSDNFLLLPEKISNLIKKNQEKFSSHFFVDIHVKSKFIINLELALYILLPNEDVIFFKTQIYKTFNIKKKVKNKLVFKNDVTTEIFLVKEKKIDKNFTKLEIKYQHFFTNIPPFLTLINE